MEQHTIYGNFELYMQGVHSPYVKESQDQAAQQSQAPRCAVNSKYPGQVSYLNIGEEPIDFAELLSLESAQPVAIKQELYHQTSPRLADNHLPYHQPGFGPSPGHFVVTGRMDQLNLSPNQEAAQQIAEQQQQHQLANAPGKSPRAKPSQILVGKKMIDKNSEEYRRRRERNNVAVRRSRDKTRHKREETEKRVAELEEENQKLREKLTLLNKEINVLKSLFSSVGTSSTSTSTAN